MAGLIGGPIVKEVVGALFVLAYVICTGSGFVGVAIGINALSSHAACTVWWAFIAFIVVSVSASIRKFQTIGWLTWVGFFSLFAAIFIVVVAVTTLDRPAAAPQTGDFDLGYKIIGNPDFVAGITASATIFVSSTGGSVFLPVISEMRNPKEYRKAVYICMLIVTASYLSMSMVVYRWCGKWVAAPSLGSAGQTMKKISYGVGLAGLIISATVYLHANSFIHWTVWLGSVFGLGIISFILAEAIPVFNYLIALMASFCFAPIGIILPAFLWLYGHNHYRSGNLFQMAWWATHWIIILIGFLIFIGGTYGVITQIKTSYGNGDIGKSEKLQFISNPTTP
ncbi:hypothetical protein jhhlp_004805 [Lomentospora prolificans]|uniref:Amino acid transporter transmembrane domain-containing protein n=1 Tax=Lomentospora prolificans TaxID=41688 RepID=A0A2N3N8Q8_9PEZI|nr:hypothetical protein jhhlp_004805 [Lomentospora prolificans]